MRLLIFDIDGTITHLDGATRRAYWRAFRELFGTDPVVDGLSMHGRTDPLIFRECFTRTGLSGDWREKYQSFKPLYLEALPESIKNTERTFLHVGVKDLIEQLAEKPTEFALALGTGNMEAGARVKIGYFGLNAFFPVGGFGDEHEERHLILQDSMDSSVRFYGREFRPEHTWVIGDTEHDVHGAQKLGLRTLAVATGGKYSVEMLAETGADEVREDLSATADLIELFRS
ncbi:MAG: HAD hydrolase-like protein [Calditrichaeota bacterium]|nr:HAD hydrolase-like protein [Calditrichota bacterium]MCB9391500.1 HAD hydrolase-like protein [Calditrichota bacterium]